MYWSTTRRSPHPGDAPTRGIGQELTFQVNYHASSDMHRGGNISWNNLAGERQYWPLAAYAQSKLALTMYASRWPSLAALRSPR